MSESVSSFKSFNVSTANLSTRDAYDCAARWVSPLTGNQCSKSSYTVPIPIWNFLWFIIQVYCNLGRALRKATLNQMGVKFQPKQVFDGEPPGAHEYKCKYLYPQHWSSLAPQHALCKGLCNSSEPCSIIWEILFFSSTNPFFCEWSHFERLKIQTLKLAVLNL